MLLLLICLHRWIFSIFIGAYRRSFYRTKFLQRENKSMKWKEQIARNDIHSEISNSHNVYIVRMQLDWNLQNDSVRNIMQQIALNWIISWTNIDATSSNSSDFAIHIESIHNLVFLYFDSVNVGQCIWLLCYISHRTMQMKILAKCSNHAEYIL